MLARRALELVAVDGALGVGREVQEGDRAAVALGAERPQHRHHGVMPLPPLISRIALGPFVGKVEVAVGLLEAEHHAGARVLGQEVRDETFRVGLDGQLELAAAPATEAGE